jgi:hypothetical protein
VTASAASQRAIGINPGIGFRPRRAGLTLRGLHGVLLPFVIVELLLGIEMRAAGTAVEFMCGFHGAS